MLDHFVVEPLESRTLLTGVTLITHGWNGHIWGFNQFAADFITKRLGGPAQAPTYTLTLNQDPHDGHLVPSIAHAPGTGTPQTSTSGEIILLLDWVGVSGNPDYSLYYVGSVVADYFRTATVDGMRLAELPLRELSISRGTGLIDEISRWLGRTGVWVDQETYCDPKPVLVMGDAPPIIYDNVAFVDNYWRTDGDSTPETDSDGVPVAGAYNSNVYWLDSLRDGWPGAPLTGFHVIPAGYYNGTIDLTATYAGEGPINYGWYDVPPDRPARDKTGFYYTSIVGGQRPSSGVWAASGGTGVRTAAGWQGAQWPNVTDLTVTSGTTVFSGRPIQVNYLHQDRDTNSTITFSLDTDRNPYNNPFAATLGSANLAASSSPVNDSASLATSGVAPGRYWLCAKISDGQGNLRYAYTAGNAPLTVLSADGSGGLMAAYYDNSDLTNQKLTRLDSAVNFAWGVGAPDAAIDADTFSVRWTGQVRPNYSQTYTFYTATDDGVRLWVNGQQLINKWQNQGGTEWSGTINLVAGQKYDIKMEYFDGGYDATAKLSWSSASQTKQIIPSANLSPPAPGLSALYYDNINFSGIAARPVDPVIAFDFGSAAPAEGMAASDWSIRWSGFFTPVDSGLTRFYTEAAGGVRLWVNDTLVIDDASGTAANHDGAINLTADQPVPIRLEFAHATGPASVRLLYSSATITKRIVDSVRLTPDTAPPATPANLRLSSQTSNSATIAWDATTDNVYVQAYNVYMQTFPGTAWVKVGNTSGTSWTQTGLSGGTQYRFRICAIDAYNQLSGFSNELLTASPAPSIRGLSALYYDNINFSGIVARPLDGEINYDFGSSPPRAGMQANDWSIRWSGFFTPVDSGLNRFYTEAAGGVRLWVNNTLVIDDASTTGLSSNFGDANLTAGQGVPIRLEFAHGSGPASIRLLFSSATVGKRVVEIARLTPDTVAPAAPANLRSSSQTSNSATIAWDPTTDNVYVQAYNVYMQTLPGTAWVKVGTTANTSWTQSGLANGSQYRFRIRAFDAYNLISDPSNELLSLI